MTYNQWYFIGYIALVVIMSLVSFIAFMSDKKKAIKGMERTKEKTLLFLSIFFGGVGALVGRVVARHKTDKKYFSLIIYLSVFCNIVLLVILGLLCLKK